ncbi:MAG TPA: hypothetical protein VN777_01270 [Terriglobales bacterium]|nr:hypothetical protein [Terriglobales bacterium]
MSSKSIPAILWGGLIAGVLDLIYAVASVTLRGYPAIVLPQAIASGLFGMKSFQGGLPTAITGVALEFLITFVATAVYYVASRKLTFLIRQAVLWGVLYGVAIYFFMNFIVVPLSAAPKFDHTWASRAGDFVVHMLFIGLPMALSVRRYSAREC